VGGRSKDSSLAGRLISYQYLNRRFTWDADFEAKIKALKPEQLNAAVKRLLMVDKISIVRAGDIK
jgi:zinc protease